MASIFTHSSDLGRRAFLWVAAAILALGTICEINAQQATLILNSGSSIQTLAGSGKDGKTTAGSATATMLGSPAGLAYDTSGNLYIADSRNHIVSRVSTDGSLTILAGTGAEGFSGDNGPATSATLDKPSGIALLTNGTLLIADTGNHRIRSISPTGVITTIAGTGTPGNTGDGGSATAARLRNPSSVDALSDGSILIADAGNHRIRKVSPSGTMSALAGTGQEGDSGDGGAAMEAAFENPSALFITSDSRIFIADSSARRVRVLQTDGTIAAYSGPELRRPDGLGIDAAGNLLISDAGQQQVIASTATTSSVISGNGLQGQSIAGPATSTSLNMPVAVATDSNGGIAISDKGNNRVEHITLPHIDFGSIAAGQISAEKTLTLQNGGKTPSHVQSVTLPAAYQSTSNGTCATTPFALASQQSCTVALVFHPTAQGTANATGTVVASGPPSPFLLTGTGTPPENLSPSLTALTSNGNISYSGAAIQLTATVAGSLLTAPTGTVSIYDGNSLLATLQLNAGSVTYSSAALTPGQHALHAVYSGDAVYATSSSSAITQTVVAAPDFVIRTTTASYSGKPSGTVTIPLTVAPVNGTLNHSISFSVTGLPPGASASFLPANVTLGGDPVLLSMLVKLPASVSLHQTSTFTSFAALFFCCVLAFRRRRVAGMALLSFAVVSFSGCGGFRGIPPTDIGSANNTTHRYTLTVTATTAGALGDTLIHSIPVQLDVTQ